MKLLSVNVGKVQPIQNAKEWGTTGIFKKPSTEPVEITKLGLVGDSIVDVENHGGEDQAVYVYGSPDYAWWSNELGYELLPGTFGENLTISELESASLNVGDYLRVGEVLLQVTSPRIPCVTLAARMGDPAFVKRFRHGERPGAYCRVIETGAVQAGDVVRVEPYTGETVGIIDLFRMFYNNAVTADELQRALAAPIGIRDRQDNEARLAKIQTA